MSNIDKSQFTEVKEETQSGQTVVPDSPEGGNATTKPSESLPDDSDAPFGRDADGKPLAPYGWTVDRKTKQPRVKLISGKPSGKGQQSDEQRLMSDIASDRSNQGGTPTAAQQPVQQTQQTYPVNISGAMFLVLLDFVAPFTLATLWNYTQPSTVRTEDLKLDSQEKADLNAVADAVVKDVLKGLSPMQQFFLCIAVIYGSKLAFCEKTAKVKKQDKPVSDGVNDLLDGKGKSKNKKTAGGGRR